MALAERVTGVALPAAEIEKIDDEVEAFEDVWILTPVLSDLPSVDVARRVLAQSDPRLDVLIETAPSDRWRPLAAAVARAAAASCGLTDDARIARTLAMLESSPGAPMPEEAAELVRQLSAQARALRDEEAASPERVSPDHARAIRRESQRAGAATTVRAATNPDALAAAVDTVYCARFVLPGDQDARLSTMRALLSDG